MYRLSVFIFLCLLSISNTANTDIPHEAKPKVWWFHGATRTTHEGITADLEAFREIGIGGVVYYDQVHEIYEEPSEVFSPKWWADLIFAAKEARRLGLTFELNLSNGYAAGGPWIDAAHSMQRLVTVEEGEPIPDGFHEIATVSVPAANKNDNTVRSITYSARAQSKSPTSAMNIPCRPGQTGIVAANFTPLPPIGTLQASDDSIRWRDVAKLPPIYNDMGWKLPQLTLSLPPTRAKYYRVDPETAVRSFRLSAVEHIDRWEEKAAFRSNFISYTTHESEILYTGDKASTPTTDSIKLRFGYIPTKAKIKHGRRGMTGYECDRLSREAAIIQYDNYFKRIADTLTAHGLRPDGVIIDSHEAGTQNWTPGLEQEFLRRRGYSLLPWLPVLQGYVIKRNCEYPQASLQACERVLHDFRMTISDMVSDCFFATIDSLCRRDGYTFTAQAIGNGMCFSVDNIAVKGRVGKPQGEFWTYQREGCYDIKEAASAARVYGKPIASAEAFTDCSYQTSFEDLKHLADFAFAMGINELVVCASPHQPRIMEQPLDWNSRHPYALNRNHPQWLQSRWLWQYLGHCMQWLRRGRPNSSIGICLGCEAPLKLLSHRLPTIPDGYEWDVFTTDAVTASGSIFTDGISQNDFRLIAIEDSAYIPLSSLNAFISMSQYGQHIQANRKALEQNARYYGELTADYQNMLDTLFAQPTTHDCPLDIAIKQAGIVPEVDYPTRASSPQDRLYFSHRRSDNEDIYFIYNRSPQSFKETVRLQAKGKKMLLINPMKGEKHYRENKPFILKLQPEETIIAIISD